MIELSQFPVHMNLCFPIPTLESSEEDFNRKYVAQKLEHGRVRLWQEIQLKVRSFLLAVDLSNFKFNEFTQILNLVNK